MEGKSYSIRTSSPTVHPKVIRRHLKTRRSPRAAVPRASTEFCAHRQRSRRAVPRVADRSPMGHGSFEPHVGGPGKRCADHRIGRRGWPRAGAAEENLDEDGGVAERPAPCAQWAARRPFARAVGGRGEGRMSITSGSGASGAGGFESGRARRRSWHRACLPASASRRMKRK